MQQNPHTVFFYMIGCPHCDRARPMWEQIKKDVPSGEAVLEIESANVPDELRSRVQGFPRFERTDVNGVLVVELEGAPASAEDLRKKLKLSKKTKSTRKGGRRARRKRYTRRR
jgi:thiol-disulfide isomerase/thioredoxin